MIRRALLLAIFAALPLRAATTYRVDFDPLGQRQEEGSAQVTIDGEHVRVVYDHPDRPRDPSQPFTIRPYVFLTVPGAEALDVQWSFREVPADGEGAHKYVGKLSYLEKSQLRRSAHCVAEVEIVTNENVHLQWLGALPFVTGFAAVDETLAASAPTIKGFPMRISVMAAREHNQVRTEAQQRTMTVRNIHEIAGSVDDH